MRVPLILLAGLALAAAPPARFTAGQMRALDRCRGLLRDIRQADQETALRKMRALLAIEREVFGPWDRNVEATQRHLAETNAGLGNWRDAIECRRAIAAIRQRLHGEGHWRCVDAALDLQEARRQAERTPEQRRKLAEADLLSGQADRLAAQGRPAEAAAIARRSLALRKQVQGERHPHYAAASNNLALMHQAMGDHAAALPLMEKALAFHREAMGERHPAYARCLNNLAMLRMAMGSHEAALPLIEEALAIRKEVLGERHPDHAEGLNNLAMLRLEMGDHRAGLPLAERALALRAAAGKRHPDYAQALNNLAMTRQAMGDYRAALPLLKEAVAVWKAVQGERHPDHALGLNNLALLLEAMGDARAALPHFKKALALREAAYGKAHPAVARTLNNLALLHLGAGDAKAALPLCEKAYAIHKAALGERHPDCLSALDNLASVHEALGDREAALPLHEKALARRRAVLGDKHPDTAGSLNNLATLRLEAGDHEAALPLLVQGLSIRREALGESHPDYAQALNNLAFARAMAGEQEAALRLLAKALALRQETLGERHPACAESVLNLASLHLRAGRPGAALPYQERGLALTRRHLALYSSFQSERQQLAACSSFRARLDWRLSMPDDSARLSHGHVLAWKGSSFAAQQARRLFAHAQADPATRKATQELLDATRSLALLAGRADPGSIRRAQQATRDREEAESRLAGLSAEFRDALVPISSEALRASLPPGVVLVDLLSHVGHDPAKPPRGQEWERRFAAWVLRADAPTVRVGLGPVRPVEEALAVWRRALEADRDPGDAPARLRALLWAPLEKHLDGARLVLVSPDGALGRLPFAALPAKKEGTFLLEEVPLAILPMPQALPRPLKPAAGKPSLLVVGGVDYGSGSGGWAPLAATLPESRAVAGFFPPRATALSGPKATKPALADALPRHRFAHLATHGYFAPATMRSALERADTRQDSLLHREGASGWNPGLLSGLVLAGANAPTEQDDGLLTAMEIAELDLSGMELAVLSACQTGLGKEAAGEGLLGLQRAFAVAGCRSVVSSLWSVHDAATAVLMERFYHHLRKENRSKAEALRQAQLDVLRHPEWVEKRLASLADAPGVRGIGKAAEKLPGKTERRSPPAWWAAWQLSGDWR